VDVLDIGFRTLFFTVELGFRAKEGRNMAWYIGLDLGQAADYTAIAGLERTDDHVYYLRHLERFPLGTSYPTIATRVVELVAGPPLAGCTIAVDHTGVGRAVVDLLTEARPNAWLVPITITAGQLVSADGQGGYHVPKKELVSTLQVLLQARRLKVARGLPFGETLRKELADFRVRITLAANEQFGAWREGQHDDMVLAVSMAAWWAELNSKHEATLTEIATRELAWHPRAYREPNPSRSRTAQIMEDLGIDPDW
jgi:hypothetical protein